MRKKSSDYAKIMKIVAVIAEYNPLHAGHCHHLAHAKGLGDHVVVVQNGGFCQRGQSCVLDKYTRAVHAIRAGADIVVELPTVYGVNCADKFAYGAIALVAGLPHPTLSFGSEAGDVDLLRRTADLLATEPRGVSERIQGLLQAGVAYPVARSNAYGEWAATQGLALCDMTQPNNILALEYMRHGADKGIEFDTIQRTAAYHDIDAGRSAGGIRHSLAVGDLAAVRANVPPYVWQDLAHCTPEQEVLYLAAARYWGEGALYDAAEGLQNRVRSAAQQADTLQQALALCATKRYTNARIRRLYTYALLGLTQDKAQQCMAQAPYYHVLAVRRNRTALLSMLSEAGTVYTTHSQLAQGGPSAQLDAHAHELYGLLHATHPTMGMQVVDM